MLPSFNFTPASGLLDHGAFPTRPASEDEARGQFQALYDQLADYLRLLASSLTGADPGGCGAALIGSAPANGLRGQNIYDQLLALKADLNNIVTGGAGAVDNSMLAPDINIGSLAQLNTAVKDSLVAAINDLAEHVGFNFQLFTSSGLFTAPRAGRYRVTVVGGGAGGEGIYTTSSMYIYAGAAGGGGGCALKYVSLAAGQQVSVTVGAAGAGGVAASGIGIVYTPGIAGGTSSFGPYCSATGGQPGLTAVKTKLTNAVGGIGVSGDVNLTGGRGDSAPIMTNTFNNMTRGAAGGSSVYSAGALANDCEYYYHSSLTGADNGQNAAGYGGGGGGCLLYQSGGGYNGGSGSPGCVLVEWCGYGG